MKQHIEIITKVRNIKEIQTKTGKYLYSFSVPISKMVGEEQLTEWIQVSILQDQQRLDLHNAKEIHFIGQLVVQEAYKDYPQGISIFGFFINPVLSQVYRQRKTRSNSPQQAAQQENAPQQVQSAAQTIPTATENPGYQSDFPVMNEGVPF